MISKYFLHYIYNIKIYFSLKLYSIYTKHGKSSFLSLENLWKLVESHFVTAPNVKKCEKQY